MTGDAAERARAGLCADCRWARRVSSGRGSLFYLCRRAVTDPAYPKYPPLPRLRCSGYEPTTAAPPTGAREAEGPLSP